MTVGCYGVLINSVLPHIFSFYWIIENDEITSQVLTSLKLLSHCVTLLLLHYSCLIVM